MEISKRETSPAKGSNLPRSTSNVSNESSVSELEPIIRPRRSPANSGKRMLTKARRSSSEWGPLLKSGKQLDRHGSGGGMLIDELPDEDVMAALAAEHEFRVRYTCKALELCCFVIFALVFFCAVGLQVGLHFFAPLFLKALLHMTGCSRDAYSALEDVWLWGKG
jgi:hypothetical protein